MAGKTVGKDKNKGKELSLKMAQLAYKALDDKQGEDIRILDISDVTVLADYFIIAHGNNKNHVKALINETDRVLSKAGFEPKNIEGNHTGSWSLLDYGDLIVHIFGKEDRYFYALERIWADGKEVSMKDEKVTEEKSTVVENENTTDSVPVLKKKTTKKKSE